MDFSYYVAPRKFNYNIYGICIRIGNSVWAYAKESVSNFPIVNKIILFKNALHTNADTYCVFWNKLYKIIPFLDMIFSLTITSLSFMKSLRNMTLPGWEFCYSYLELYDFWKTIKKKLYFIATFLLILKSLCFRSSENIIFWSTANLYSFYSENFKKNNYPLLFSRQCHLFSKHYFIPEDFDSKS